jgi:hypothetical protein
MLQRIQSVYLLLVAVLMVAMTFLPLAILQRGGALYSFEVFGITSLSDPTEIDPMWGLFVLTALIAILAVVTIFLYKKRILQIRICVFNAILMIGFYGFFAFLIYMMYHNIADLSVNIKIALSFPLISLILDYLAIRNIGADEVLVRSVDRLRK